MAKISVRVSDPKRDALEHIKNEYGISLTEATNDALRLWLKNYAKDLPVHLEKDTKHEDIVKRNRHRMRRLQFKQRVHDKLVSFLEDEKGNTRRFPPEPDKVEEEYIESLRQEVHEEHEKYDEEYATFLDHQLEWYYMQHPDTDAGEGKSYEEIVKFTAEHLDADRQDFAREYLHKAKQAGHIETPNTPKKVIQDAIELIERENWRDEWETAARGNKA